MNILLVFDMFVSFVNFCILLIDIYPIFCFCVFLEIFLNVSLDSRGHHQILAETSLTYCYTLYFASSFQGIMIDAKFTI